MYEVSEIQNSVVVVCFTSEEAINEDFQIATDDHNSATSKVSNWFLSTFNTGFLQEILTMYLSKEMLNFTRED